MANGRMPYDSSGMHTAMSKVDETKSSPNGSPLANWRPKRRSIAPDAPDLDGPINSIGRQLDSLGDSGLVSVSDRSGYGPVTGDDQRRVLEHLVHLRSEVKNDFENLSNKLSVIDTHLLKTVELLSPKALISSSSIRSPREGRLDSTSPKVSYSQPNLRQPPTWAPAPPYPGSSQEAPPGMQPPLPDLPAALPNVPDQSTITTQSFTPARKISPEKDKEKKKK